MTIHFPVDPTERPKVWVETTPTRYEPACGVRRAGMRFTNDANMITCSRCKAAMRTWEQRVEAEMAAEYDKKMRAPLSKEALVAWEEYKARPQCDERAEFIYESVRCMHRQGHTQGHWARYKDRETRLPITIQWDTVES